MILAVDVHYTKTSAVVAGVLFENWDDSEASRIVVSQVKTIKEYATGEFYKRELPCITALLDEHSLTADTIVIDGYVYLDSDKKEGLGADLYAHLNESVKIIGVAKNPFRDITEQCKVLRGESKKPLYVTSIGYSLDEAEQYIKSMDGEFRFPSLLKMVDTLCCDEECTESMDIVLSKPESDEVE